jgi:hypothetical protein
VIAEPSKFHGGSEQDEVFLDFRPGADHLVDISRALFQDAFVHLSLLVVEFDTNLFVERFWQIKIFLIPTQANCMEQCSKVHGLVRGIFAERFQDVPLEERSM